MDWFVLAENPLVEGHTTLACGALQEWRNLQSLAATVGIEVVTNFPLPKTNPGPALYVGGRRGLIRPAR